MTGFEDLKEAKEILEKTLFLPMPQMLVEKDVLISQTLGKENIVGVGIGEKVTKGKPTGYVCVKVYVVAKAPMSKVKEETRVPVEVDGIKTDVEEVGVVRASKREDRRLKKGMKKETVPIFNQNQKRLRPAYGGASISHEEVTAGTLGCLVKRVKSKEIGKDMKREEEFERIKERHRDKEGVFILSNNHVIANSNRAENGDKILQPGVYDGGVSPDDIVAELHDFIPVDFEKINEVDAAIAKPLSPWKKYVSPLILEIGEVKGEKEPELGMLVKKSGRTTGLTSGKITGLDATFNIGYDRRIARFRGQIVISPRKKGVAFSQGGDSGSLIVNEENSAVGLLFAGNEDGSITIANPINVVFEKLKIKIMKD
ncbi:MAG: hypothetical protein AB1410_04885 [Acidobacteriota bacterium]